LHCEYVQISPAQETVKFDANGHSVYQFFLGNVWTPKFLCVENAQIPMMSNDGSSPSGAYVTCESDKLLLHLVNAGQYDHVLLIEEDDISDLFGNIAVLLNSISSKMDTANARLAEIATNTGRIQ
jgi:hypothetical protein